MSEQEGTITTARAAARKKSMPVEAASPMAALADDVLLQILARLEGDPRDWARAACVSPRLAVLLRGACFPPRLARALPAELLPPPSDAPDAWAALQKLSVCCPGLMRAGVLLEPSDDFGLELDIGPDHSFSPPRVSKNLLTTTAESKNQSTTTAESKNLSTTTASSLDAGVAWSLYDDLYLDAAYDSSEAQIPTSPTTSAPDPGASGVGVVAGSRRRPRRWLGPVGAHLASGSWTLSREQGNKLLASRFRGDRLYICDWPGCVHAEERRKYMVFRGVFQNFERSQVRRTLRDTRRPTVAVECAFCACKETWDLYSAFCLRSFYGFHDDGEPVVRAYVCANGHVAGAWTERPMYA